MLWGDVLQHAYIIHLTTQTDVGSGMSIPTARNVAQACSEHSGSFEKDPLADFLRIFGFKIHEFLHKYQEESRKSRSRQHGHQKRSPSQQLGLQK
ncbi:hypothetical protein TNCV_1924631 [Trichonephila clavipes]|nr:hypothetical protein TNCV_1924631 [Trichonephila clavipes]